MQEAIDFVHSLNYAIALHFKYLASARMRNE